MKYRKLKKGDQITVDTQIFIKQTGKWHNIFGFRVGDFGSGSPSSYRRPIKSKVAQNYTNMIDAVDESCSGCNGMGWYRVDGVNHRCECCQPQKR